MSTIFGIFNRSGASVDYSRLAVMQAAASYWNPDDSNVGAWENVGLGHAMLWNTPESRRDELPREYTDSGRILVITADARLDNREELIEKLCTERRPVIPITDSELLVAAYRAWGTQSPRYLLGDFAYAIWDATRGSLFCARDHLGIRPFLYSTGADSFAFASDIPMLLNHEGVPDAIADEAVAIYMNRGELLHPTHTFYGAIKKLEPATTLLVTEKEFRIERYWRPEDVEPIVLGSTQEYATALRSLLEASVEARLRTDYPVGAHLSGGLDSSTISTIAARQLSTRGRSLETYSWMSRPSNEEEALDSEWSLSRLVADNIGSNHHYADMQASDLREILKSHDICRGDTVDLWYEFLTRDSAAGAGVRTMLSGWGGDEFITDHGLYRYADTFWRGRLFSTLRAMAAEAALSKRPLRRFLALGYRGVVVPRFRRSQPIPEIEPPGFLSCAQDKFAAYAQRFSNAAPGPVRPRVRAHQIAKYRRGFLHSRIDGWAASGKAVRIEYAYPLLDKRIVEFALAIPAQMYRQEGKRRFLFRKSIEDILPREVCWSSSKSEPRRVKKFFEQLRAVLSDWALAGENVAIDNPYVSARRVKKLIAGLEDDSIESERKRLLALVTGLRSIMVLNMGSSLQVE